MAVELRPQDADAILAMAEWALSRPVVVCCPECGHTSRQTLEIGPGLSAAMAEEACRRIESVADLHRRGVVAGPGRWRLAVRWALPMLREARQMLTSEHICSPDPLVEQIARFEKEYGDV